MKLNERVRELRRIWSGFQMSRVLMTANNLGIFNHLKKPVTAAAVARRIRADRRAVEILLDALTGLALLQKRNGRYRNTSLASVFLVSGKPYYQGDIISHADNLWDSWSVLDRVIRSGRPAREAHNHRAFILGMHNLAVTRARDIVRQIGLKGVRRALDLGGGPGTYALELARHGISVTLFDRDETISIARKVQREAGPLRGDVTCWAGDFITDDIGRGYDLIFASQIIHSYSEKQNVQLLRKCRRSLNSGGRLVIHEFLINEQRTSPVWSSLFAINMLVNTEGGRTYSPGEMRQWLLKTGFRSIRKTKVPDGVLMIGTT